MDLQGAMGARARSVSVSLMPFAARLPGIAGVLLNVMKSAMAVWTLKTAATPIVSSKIPKPARPAQKIAPAATTKAATRMLAVAPTARKALAARMTAAEGYARVPMTLPSVLKMVAAYQIAMAKCAAATAAVAPAGIVRKTSIVRKSPLVHQFLPAK